MRRALGLALTYVAAAGTGFSVAWFTLAHHPWACAVFGETVAVWVQAVGVIAAIAVAIWVPIRIDARAARRDKQKEKLVARSVALQVRPLLGEYEDRLAHVLRSWSGTPSAPTMQDTFYGDRIPSEGEKIADWIKVPAELEAIIPQLPMLGEPGIEVQAVVQRAREVALRARYMDSPYHPTPVSERRKAARIEIDDLKSDVQKANTQIWRAYFVDE